MFISPILTHWEILLRTADLIYKLLKFNPNKMLIIILCDFPDKTEKILIPFFFFFI